MTGPTRNRDRARGGRLRTMVVPRPTNTNKRLLWGLTLAEGISGSLTKLSHVAGSGAPAGVKPRDRRVLTRNSG
jgi:hypothetical protein